MEQILKNLNDPSWWFTGMFFVLVGLFLTKLLFNWFPSLLRSVSRKIPVYGDKLSRRFRLKILKAIKRNRQHQVRVNWVITRYWSLATISTIYAFFALVMFLMYPKSDNASIANNLIPLALFVPMYFLQFITIVDKKIALRVMKAHIQWKKRIARSSSKDAKASRLAWRYKSQSESS